MCTHLIIACDIISTPAELETSLGAGSESKMTCAHGFIHICTEEKEKRNNTKFNFHIHLLSKIQSKCVCVIMTLKSGKTGNTSTGVTLGLL